MKPLCCGNWLITTPVCQLTSARLVLLTPVSVVNNCTSAEATCVGSSSNDAQVIHKKPKLETADPPYFMLIPPPGWSLIGHHKIPSRVVRSQGKSGRNAWRALV